MMKEITLESMAQLTKANMHGQAYVAGCQYLMARAEWKYWRQLDWIIRELQRVNGRHEYLGHLTPELNINRYQLYKDMMGLAGEILSEEENQKFYLCF